MIKDLIRRQFLNGNTSEHDAYMEICNDRDWEPADDLYELFKVEYDAVIQSDWWQRVQQEQRKDEWFDEDTYETDLKAFRIEKNKMVNRHG